MLKRDCIKYAMRKVFIVIVILLLLPIATAFSSCKVVDDKISVETSNFNLNLFLNDDTLEGQCIQELTVQENGRIPIQFYPIYQSSKGDMLYEIQEISIDGIITDYEIDKTNHCILPTKELTKGDRSTISVKYKIFLKSGDYKLGINNKVYALTRAYPYAAYYNNGYSPRPFTDIGESECFECANFYVKLKLKSNMVVASTGKEVSNNMKGDCSIREYTRESVRDFAIICSPYFTLRTEKVDGTTLRYYFYDDKSFADNLSIAADALSHYNSIFTKYDYDALNIVRAPMDASGMEYSCLAVVNDKLSQKEAKEVIAHEIAHQWWFLKVGNDQASEPWLDEALAEFSSMHFLLKRGEGKLFQKRIGEGENVASTRTLKNQQIKIGLSVYEYDKQDYADCVYTLGFLMWSKLYELYGNDIIEDLKGYAEKYSLLIASKEHLIASIKDGILAEYFNAWLEGNVAFSF